jgi:hypothetical protein
MKRRVIITDIILNIIHKNTKKFFKILANYMNQFYRYQIKNLKLFELLARIQLLTFTYNLLYCTLSTFHNI